MKGSRNRFGQPGKQVTGASTHRTVMSDRCLGLQASLRSPQGRKPREPNTGWTGSGLAKGAELLLPQRPWDHSLVPRRANPGLTQLGIALDKRELILQLSRCRVWGLSTHPGSGRAAGAGLGRGGVS